MKKTILHFSKSVIGICCVFFLINCQPVEQEMKPNIIYILADDLGYGDVSCYGQTKFSTPNIDRLAKEGIKFTQHYAGSTVCAPSRSALMTGQHTGHTPVRGNKEHKPVGQWPLPATSPSMAKLFKQAGYATGVFGKWGLGYPNSEGDPLAQGFDVFYGYNCQRNAHNYYPWHLYHNNEKIVLAENAGAQEGVYAPIPIHEQALKFIDDNKDQPFFMYYPNVLPHAEMFAPESYMAKYRGKLLPERVYKGVASDHPSYKKGAYGSQPEGHAAFAAMVSLMDDQVGEIMQKLEDLGIADNTLIVFTSDNGPHMEGGADPEYFNSNGGLRGFKRDLYEGGIRVPMVAKWPGKIKAGTVSDHISAFWDMLPTFAEIIGAEQPEHIDGISMLPALTGTKTQKQHPYLYWEFHERGGRQAVRMGQWKGVKYNVKKQPDAPIELFNLDDDPNETTNIAAQHPDIVEELTAILESARTESEVFKF
ncbi:MAG: arylsulfatase [Marinilabiliaceae bacterium]|nr:arylsulfatase [Marinilabiliaceae bacterium]